MKQVFISVLIAALILTTGLPGGLPSLRAQNPAEMMPAASAAKTKAILNQAIAALGGPVYLRVRNSDCSGRYVQFEHSGAVGDYLVLRDYRGMPDKNRVEYDPKGIIVDVYAGSQGWSLDRGGVSEIPAKDMADYLEQLKTDVNYILRFRMNDPTLVFRYGGREVVDLKLSDWVEITDREGHTIRIAIDTASHLPVRSQVINRDEEGEKVERAAAFTNYHSIDGIQTPYQISRFRNGQQVYQAFYDSCQYNEILPDDFFTRESLDAHFAKTRKK